MRLIDADDIPYTMLYKENWMGTTGKEARGAWKSDIDKMPTIDAVPVRHGEWIKLDSPAFLEYYKCSVCDEESLVPTRMGEPIYAYCPHCGAKMDLKGEEDGTDNDKNR